MRPAPPPKKGVTPRPPLGSKAEVAAAHAIQRIVRGRRARALVAGWTRIVDEDGDIYWYNVITEESSWVPPGAPADPDAPDAPAAATS